MANPNIYAGIRLWLPILGNENQTKVLGGYFTPNGTSAPTANSVGKERWIVSRIATGRFLVKLSGTLQGNTTQSTLAKIQSIIPTLQVDPAQSVQTLNITVGPVTGTSFELDVTNSTTGALTDITQPGSPTAQGTLIHWVVQISNDNTTQYNVQSLAE